MVMMGRNLARTLLQEIGPCSKKVRARFDSFYCQLLHLIYGIIGKFSNCFFIFIFLFYYQFVCLFVYLFIYLFIYFIVLLFYCLFVLCADWFSCNKFVNYLYFNVSGEKNCFSFKRKTTTDDVTWNIQINVINKIVTRKSVCA